MHLNCKIFNRLIDFLKDSLKKICAYLENVDVEAIEKMLNELFEYGWEEDVISQLSIIDDKLRVFDYEGVSDAIAVLLTAYDK